MYDNESDPPPSEGRRKQKKRLHYNRISDDMKRDLVFRVMYLNENIRDVCQDISCNFLTGRNLIQKYKKTGEYATFSKPGAIVTPPASTTKVSSHDSDRRVSKCPFGIILLGDGELQLVSSKSYTQGEEAALLELHKLFLVPGLLLSRLHA